MALLVDERMAGGRPAKVVRTCAQPGRVTRRRLDLMTWLGLQGSLHVPQSLGTTVPRGARAHR
jgi:hypothetical protein